MANTKLIFCGNGDCENHELQAYVNTHGNLFIGIDMSPQDANNYDASAFITLDKSTAIKLSREIRKQIAEMED